MSKNKYNYWKKLEIIAKNNINFSGNKILIEIAAQHPLINGIIPNPEFEKRLNKGIKIFKKYKLANYKVYLYIPGSRHKPDKISLSKAGEHFLLSNKIPQSNIYSDEINFKYKNTDGVYNSIDECEVASKIFFDNNFDKLISVCSSAQLHRKALAYIKFGIFPEMISIPVENMFHSYVNEAFKYIPDFISSGELNNKNKKERRNQ